MFDKNHFFILSTALNFVAEKVSTPTWVLKAFESAAKITIEPTEGDRICLRFGVRIAHDQIQDECIAFLWWQGGKPHWEKVWVKVT